MAGLDERLVEWSDALGLPAGVLAVLVATIAAFAIGSILRIGFHALRPTEASADRMRSLRSWWGIVLALTGAVLIGPLGVIVLMAAASAAALHEYLGLVRTAVGRGPIVLAYAAIPLQYGCIALDRLGLAAIVTPVLVSIALLVALVVRGRTARYAAEAGELVLGALVTVYLLSFAAMLPRLDDGGGSPETPGWFVLLVLLTMTSDIVQALVGRPLGRRRILPGISPGKTWEGWIGGALATTALAAGIGPVLTPLSAPFAAVIGLIVAVAGLFGDLNISALKRDRGVEDSGTLLAGQGGLLDRVDALSFAAPLLFLYARAWLGLSG